MQAALPSIPSNQEWAQLGFTDVVELAGGQQSIVFSARSDGGVVAVKLTDAKLVRLELMERRAAFISELAQVEDLVAPPVKISGRLVRPFGDWFVTATTFVDGEPLDTTVAADAELMGVSLAGLHKSMRLVSGSSLPDVDALRIQSGGPSLDLGQYQPLHGDFNSSNLRRTPSGARVFDLDDCGNGPVEFDAANALYMVLFDSVVNSGSTANYDDFRTPFVAGYSERSGESVPGTILDSLIDLRVRALEHWIDNPAEAPIGIRTSSPEWIDRLRQFVKTWSQLTDQQLTAGGAAPLRDPVRSMSFSFADQVSPPTMRQHSRASTAVGGHTQCQAHLLHSTTAECPQPLYEYTDRDRFDRVEVDCAH